jgi:hypothetical protein
MEASMRGRVLWSVTAAALLLFIGTTPTMADQVGIGGWGGFDLACGNVYTSVPIGFDGSRWGITTVPDLQEGEMVSVTLEPFIQPYAGGPPGTLEIIGSATTTFTVPAGWRGDLSDPADTTKSFTVPPFFRLHFVPDPAGFDGGVGVVAHLRGDRGYVADSELPAIAMHAAACPVPATDATARTDTAESTLPAPTSAAASIPISGSRSPAANGSPQPTAPSATTSEGPSPTPVPVAEVESATPSPTASTATLAESSASNGNNLGPLALIGITSVLAAGAGLGWRRARNRPR